MRSETDQTMTEHITEDDYESEVSNQAAYLVEDVDTDEPAHLQRDQVMDTYHDSLHGHDWFFKSQSITLYASIIEHADSDPDHGHDLTTLTDAESIEEIVEEAAYNAFATDVYRTALNALDL